MKIMQRFIELISRGEQPDPDERVELIVVGGTSGPMTVARLRQDGFDAAGHEEFNVATKLASDYRISGAEARAGASASTVERHPVSAARAASIPVDRSAFASAPGATC